MLSRAENERLFLAGKFRKGSNFMGKLSYELPVVIGKPKERLEFLEIFWLFLSLDYCNFFGIHPDLPWRDDMAEEFDFLLMEFAFLGFCQKISILEELKYLVNVFFVFFFCFRVDEDIVEVAHCEDV